VLTFGRVLSQLAIVSIYDKPMVYYPLTTLMMAGIRDILIISTSNDTPRFEQLLGNGSQWGLQLSYKVQDAPRGLPEAFIIGEKFIGGDSCALMLGDNLFFGYELPQELQEAAKSNIGATVFAYQVTDPERYGVIEFDAAGRAISLEEKPQEPKSKFAIPGLYFCDNEVISIAKSLVPSARGELEIVDLLKHYLNAGNLHVQMMGRGRAWLDTGTPDSLLEASHFIQTIEKRQGLKIACPEEIAYRMGYITAAQLTKLAGNLDKTAYARYLLNLLA
jgi:glucose-1-phosphate thymidylyltransferase